MLGRDNGAWTQGLLGEVEPWSREDWVKEHSGISLEKQKGEYAFKNWVPRENKASKILSSRAKPSCQEVWRLPMVMYSGGTPAECISPVAAETNGHTRDPSKQNTWVSLHIWKSEVQIQPHWGKTKVLAGRLPSGTLVGQSVPPAL